MTTAQQDNTGNRNLLDGYTILRFAHAFESGGGVEQYLEDLDRTLLDRNKITILRMYQSDDIGNVGELKEKIGQGTLVKIPLDTEQAALQTDADRQSIESSRGTILKNLLRDWVVFNPILYPIIFKNIVKNLSSRTQTMESLDAKQVAERLFKNFKIDLVIMHYAGGADSNAIIKIAKASNVPYVFINHFSNDRFNHMSIREQLADAASIAGVSSVNVPRRLRNIFFNVSDGIDTEMFKPENTRPIRLNNKTKIVFLPARIVAIKGQSDLITACAMLKNKEIHIKVVLAGRADSLRYEEQLKKHASELNILDDILFVGQLDREQLRNWYGASAILAFPSYNEGFPRILMEAQAMGVPPVAYNVGGMSEGILQGKTGYLVPKGNITLFTEKLKELLTNEGKRKQMGENGRKFIVNNFSLQALAVRHEEFYLKILKKA